MSHDLTFGAGDRQCKMLLKLTVAFACLLAPALSDTPANCSYNDAAGSWVFSIGSRGHDKSLNCTGVSHIIETPDKLGVQLLFPDVAIDQFGNKGWWTLIYNQGFEVVIAGRKYFAYFQWKDNGGTTPTSVCTATRSGWSHDVYVRDWACFSASKDQLSEKKQMDTSTVHYREATKEHRTDPREMSKRLYQHNKNFIKKINSAQKSWKAVKYAEYSNLTIEHMIRRAGGRKSKIAGIPRPADVDEKTQRLADLLPSSWDWRKVDGVNYVSPIRNQGGCGSCYAFASMGMNEARVRVMTNNTQQPVFSPQDIVECSEYSQGCEGGFPYLIGGKYAEDFGLVFEKCNTYTGRDGKCSTYPSCGRHYATNYRYIGGFYGACNEALMKIALVKNGPVGVAFMVYSDFMHYKTGVYHHVEELEDHFNPFEITNHAVLLVGYGTDNDSGEDYWLVKNSWGQAWGEDGYFRIKRGHDECAIESIAVESFPIL